VFLEVAAIVYTLLYLLCLGHAMFKHRISQKFNLLVLNKSVADLGFCVAIGFAQQRIGSDAKLTSQMEDFVAIQLAWAFLICSFTNYTFFLALKIYGVNWPFHFRKRLTVTIYVQIVIFSWCLFAFTFVFLATIKFLFIRKKLIRFVIWISVTVFLILLHIIVMIALSLNIYLISSKWRIAKRKFNRNLSRGVTLTCYRFPVIKASIRLLVFPFFQFPLCIVGLWRYRWPPALIWISLALARILVDAISGIHADIESQRSFMHFVNKILPRRMTKNGSSASAISITFAGSAARRNQNSYLSLRSADFAMLPAKTVRTTIIKTGSEKFATNSLHVPPRRVGSASSSSSVYHRENDVGSLPPEKIKPYVILSDKHNKQKLEETIKFQRKLHWRRSSEKARRKRSVMIDDIPAPLWFPNDVRRNTLTSIPSPKPMDSPTNSSIHSKPKFSV